MAQFAMWLVLIFREGRAARDFASFLNMWAGGGLGTGLQERRRGQGAVTKLGVLWSVDWQLFVRWWGFLLQPDTQPDSQPTSHSVRQPVSHSASQQHEALAAQSIRHTVTDLATNTVNHWDNVSLLFNRDCRHLWYLISKHDNDSLRKSLSLWKIHL